MFSFDLDIITLIFFQVTLYTLVLHGSFQVHFVILHSNYSHSVYRPPHISSVTKCLRPLVKHWRSQGIFIVLYLDDGWCRAETESKCLEHAIMVKADLLAAGLVPNKNKSVCLPTPKLDWLGLTWDANVGTIGVIERRISDILSFVNEIQISLPICLHQTFNITGRKDPFPLSSHRIHCTVKI